LFYFIGETALVACVLKATSRKKGRQLFEEKVHPGDLAWGFSDLVHNCAPFIRRIKNFSQFILKYTIIMSHNKSQSESGVQVFLWLESESHIPHPWSVLTVPTQYPWRDG